MQAKQGSPCLQRIDGPWERQVAIICPTGQDKNACTFAESALKPALEAAGLNVFLDLGAGCEQHGKPASAALNSAVVVVVLSEQCTQRKWCVSDLDQQQQQQQQQQQRQPLVITAFYNAGCVFVQHHRELDRLARFDGPGLVDPEYWSKNMCAVTEDLPSLSLPPAEASTQEKHQLAWRVVAAALKAVPVQFQHYPVFGLEQVEADLLAYLVVPAPDCLGLWLHGSGGIGKTTLATMLFNRLAPNFQHTAYVQLQDDEESSSQQLVGLLKQLGALEVEESTPAPVLLVQLQEYVDKKRVLLLVDNVRVAGDLDKLLPTKLAEGSRLIITSRAASCPDSCWFRQMGHQLAPYKVPPLSDDAAVHLFRQRANLDPGFIMPSEQLDAAERGLIRACGGLPLALTLAGAVLRSAVRNQPRPLSDWQAVQHRLQEGPQHGRGEPTPEHKLTEIIQMTFNSLDHQLQEVFLDAATVLRGQPKGLALAVWNSWHDGHAEALFAKLMRRGLMDCVGEGIVQVHDVLVAFARQILQDPGSPYCGTRLWVDDGIEKEAQQGGFLLGAWLDREGNANLSVPPQVLKSGKTLVITPVAEFGGTLHLLSKQEP